MSLTETLTVDGATIEVCAVQNGGDTTFTIKVVSGYADLRGFFFDHTSVDDIFLVGSGTAYDGDGNQLLEAVTDSEFSGDLSKVGSNDNNMNGTGETFDTGLLFGGSGGMTYQGTSDDVQWITFTIEDLTLNELSGQEFGIRALSVGEYREDSVKLLGTFDVTDDDDGGGVIIG